MALTARIVVLLAALLFVAPLVRPASLQISDAQRQLLESLNRERTALGRAPLSWDDALAFAATQHASVMAKREVLSHQLAGELPLEQRAAQAGARFSEVAENVALGPDAVTIHSLWMHSPGHRANILDPRLTSVGIALVPGSEGLFAVEDFSRVVGDLSIEQQERQVSSLLTARGVQTMNADSAARRACNSGRLLPGDHPAFVLRFETANLRKLPENLDHMVQKRKYRSAAVGACQGGDGTVFTQYRVAVLLYP